MESPFSLKFRSVNCLGKIQPLILLWKRKGAKKSPPTNFSSVTSLKVRICPQNSLNFSFYPFATLL